MENMSSYKKITRFFIISIYYHKYFLFHSVPGKWKDRTFHPHKSKGWRKFYKYDGDVKGFAKTLDIIIQKVSICFPLCSEQWKCAWIWSGFFVFYGVLKHLIHVLNTKTKLFILPCITFMCDHHVWIVIYNSKYCCIP